MKRTFEEIYTNKYNDLSFQIFSNIYLDLHNDF